MKVVVTLTKKFFDQHPRAGQPTGFADAVKAGTKIHTCRDNYDYWVKKVEALARNDGFTDRRDFTAFIDPLFAKYGTDTITLAIIHFTPYRYGSGENR